MTDYPKGTFRYIDKDKILPSLEKRRKELMELTFTNTSEFSRMMLLECADEIGKVIDNIELGMYDWNQGSE